MTPDELLAVSGKIWPGRTKHARVHLLVEAIGVSESTIWNYFSGRHRIPEPTARLLKFLAKKPRG